jgi:hypothetical protein
LRTSAAVRKLLCIAALAWLAAGLRDVARYVTLKRKSRRLHARLELWAAERGVVLLQSARATSPIADSARRR